MERQVTVEKRGLLGFKKAVMGTRAVEVEGKTYRKIKDLENKKPYSVEEMLFYDMIDEEW